MKKGIFVHGALFLVALLYGGNYVIAKAIMPEYFPAILIVLFRVLFGLFFFWIFALFFPNERIRRTSDYLQIALCALLGVATNQMLFFKGLSLTSPINASLVMTVTPILVLVASRIVLKEKIKGTKVLGVLLGFSGAILLIYSSFGNLDISQGNWRGDLMVFANASSYGLYLVMVKPLIEKYRTTTVVKWLFTFGLFMVAPFGLMEWPNFSASQVPDWSWLNLAYILIGVTILAYFLNAWALNYANPSLVGIYIYLQPILATTISILLFQDILSPEKIISGLLIFLGVYFVSIRK